MTNRVKKKMVVVERQDEMRPDMRFEKKVAIGDGVYGEIFEGFQMTHWAKRRLEQAVKDVRWLRHVSTRFLVTPDEIKELLRDV